MRESRDESELSVDDMMMRHEYTERRVTERRQTSELAGHVAGAVVSLGS